MTQALWVIRLLFFKHKAHLNQTDIKRGNSNKMPGVHQRNQLPFFLCVFGFQNQLYKNKKNVLATFCNYNSIKRARNKTSLLSTWYQKFPSTVEKHLSGGVQVETVEKVTRNLWKERYKGYEFSNPSDNFGNSLQRQKIL